MNALNPANDFTFHDGFRPVKIFAGERIFEMLAPQRTTTIFGVASEPSAAATYYIDDLIVQREEHLNEWDLIALSDAGDARVVRHNTVVYELQCTIPADIIQLHSNFFYRCPECNRHIYDCNHLLIEDPKQPYRPDSAEPSTVDERMVCPSCGGKVQSLAPGVSFCLDCEWERGLAPIKV